MDAMYAIGSQVSCSDGGCGRLERVVVDPVARALTHLVVRPDEGADRLVPVDLVEDGDETADLVVRLRCSADDFQNLESAEESEFAPAYEDMPGSGEGRTGAWPGYPLGMATVGVGAPGVVPLALPPQSTRPPTTTYERVPTGEVQIRRGQRVQATDGEIGHVQGLVVDPRDHHVTHVLLQEGHLLGKRTVAVPIGTVTRVGHGVRVGLSKKELNDLPTVEPSGLHA
jgi:sporulation protein YlmC with PRC-barrel domain